MRKIIRQLFWLVLILLMVLQSTDFVETFDAENPLKTEIKVSKNDVKSSKTYILSESNRLAFNIPNFTDRLKFVFTANLNPLEKITENIRDIRYSVTYEIFDHVDKIITSKTYHLKTSYLLYMDDNDTMTPILFYDEVSLCPTTSQTLPIDLNQYKGAAKIVLSVASQDDKIEDIGIRGYFLERVPDENLNLIWERMSLKKREELFDGNIYGLDYLTQKEKDVLLSTLWKPNGPLGIEGKGYQTRRLLKLKKYDHLSPLGQFQPTIYSDILLNASRFLKKGNYKIEVMPLDGRSVDINISHYVNDMLVDTNNHGISDQNKTIHFDVKDSGLVVFESSGKVSYEIIDMDANKPLYMPPVLSADFYIIDENHSIEYEFFSEKERFIRVECRANESNNTTVMVTFKDKNGTTVKYLESVLDFVQSKYDYTGMFEVQSEAAYIYMVMPPNIRTMSIVASDQIITKLSSRSDTTLYPLHSFNKKNNELDVRIPAWFPVYPKGYTLSTMKERQTPLYKQESHSQVNEFVQSGKYRYKQIYPEGTWHGYEILMKRLRDDTFIRSQSWSSIYSKLVPKKTHEIIFYEDIGLQDTVPKVIYHNKEYKEGNITLYLDGKKVVQYETWRGSGTTLFPEVAVNTLYNIKFDTSNNMDIYLSHTAKPSQTYMKRSFVRIDNPLQFIVKKQTHLAETVSIQLASKKEDLIKLLSYDMHISSSLGEDLIPYKKFSFNNYKLHFDLSMQEAISLTKKESDMVVSSPVYVTLGENISPGEYKIDIYPTNNDFETYIHLNHLIMDTQAKSRISKGRL